MSNMFGKKNIYDADDSKEMCVSSEDEFHNRSLIDTEQRLLECSSGSKRNQTQKRKESCFGNDSNNHSFVAPLGSDCGSLSNVSEGAGSNSCGNNDDLFDSNLLDGICAGFEDVSCEDCEILNDKHLLYGGSKSHRNRIRFPNVLYSILNNDRHSHVAYWTLDGKTFNIRGLDNFEKEVLPLYFKTSRLKSFQKQLSIYGFKSTKFINDVITYYHKYFMKNNPEMLLLLRRVNISSKK